MRLYVYRFKHLATTDPCCQKHGGATYLLSISGKLLSDVQIGHEFLGGKRLVCPILKNGCPMGMKSGHCQLAPPLETWIYMSTVKYEL